MTTPQSYSDRQVAELQSTLERVADANAYAAELVVELELTREQLERQNQALLHAKAAAEESDRLKSVFLATMSHELRTPLNVIIGYSEMLQEELEELRRPEVSTDLGRIRNAATHLLALISDILDFSKVEAGRLALCPEPLHVVDVLQEVCAAAAPLMEANGNRLERECAEKDLQVMADAARLRQCLWNLLSNAAKFTKAGSIRITARSQAGSVLFDVIDTGIGIPADTLPRLFEPFVQAGTSEVRTQSGTGLGLAISRRLARLMHGDLTAQSQPGAGSTFTLRLPRP